MLNRELLAQQLSALGIRPGKALLVHSSLSSVGWVAGGAATVVSALLDVLGSSGTLLVPTLTGTPLDGPAHPPSFDLATARSWTGAIAETARQWPGAFRSCHPTHSVAALGAHARMLTADHQLCASPCAAGSPYDRLADAGGSILLLGVSHAVNTSLHMAEELANVPYHLQERATVSRLRCADGWQEVSCKLHLWQWDRDFAKIEPNLLSAGGQVSGRIGAAHCLLVRADIQRQVALDRLRADPLFLLHDQARLAYMSENRIPPVDTGG